MSLTENTEFLFFRIPLFSGVASMLSQYQSGSYLFPCKTRMLGSIVWCLEGGTCKKQSDQNLKKAQNDIKHPEMPKEAKK